MFASLAGRSVIVTGASQGIGRGIALRFGLAGCCVLVVARHLPAAQRVVDEITAAGGSAVAFAGDVGRTADMQAMAAAAAAQWGGIDILCANAGIFPASPLETMTEADFDAVMSTNLKGTFLAVSACLPAMKQRRGEDWGGDAGASRNHSGDLPGGGGHRGAGDQPGASDHRGRDEHRSAGDHRAAGAGDPPAASESPGASHHRGGRIILTSSITGPVTGYAGWSHYGASKAGQLGFMRTAAIELAPHGITVNAVLPGNIATEGLAGMGDDYVRQMTAFIPLKRLGTVTDIANAVLFFASDEAAYITGQSLVIDGGQILPESLGAMAAV